MRPTTARYIAAGATAVVLLTALTIMVNWLSVRHWVRADWTSAKLYSLSEKTEAILTGLDQEIEVVVFMTKGSSLYPQVHELLDRYTAASSLITVSYIDPDREPLRTQQLAEKYGIPRPDTVVFTHGDRTKYVTTDELVEYDYSGMQYGGQPQLKSFKGEEEFTSAILSLTATSIPTIFFVTGHGEASTGAPTSAADRTVSVLDEALKRENMHVGVTSLLTGEVPEDADVLAIVGPTKPFTEGEIKVLDEYLASGGRMLVCLDPLISEQGTMRLTRLEALVADYGVHCNDDLVIDPKAELQGWGPSAVYLDNYAEHPITAGLKGVASLYLVARSLEANPGDGWQAQELVTTSDDGWGETSLASLVQGEEPSLDDDDNQGPVAVAVAVKEQQGEPGEQDGDAPGAARTDGFRLVVFGDADFVTDSIIPNLGNMTIAMNSINWLAEREQIVGIPARDLEHQNMYLSQSSLGLILLLCVFALPAAAVVTGVAVWRRRRH